MIVSVLHPLRLFSHILDAENTSTSVPTEDQLDFPPTIACMDDVDEFSCQLPSPVVPLDDGPISLELILYPGAKVQWLNSYNQWQNAVIVKLDNEQRARITEDINGRSTLCATWRIRGRYDEHCKLREQPL